VAMANAPLDCRKCNTATVHNRSSMLASAIPLPPSIDGKSAT
jgi:hypothetical protein